jgi:hypothetical protein
MATEADIAKIQTAFGPQAQAGSYTIDGREVNYDGPGSQPSDDSADTVENDKRRTPDSWDGPEDARSLPGAGRYPNYYSHKTRSGHVIMMDDSLGAEHVTIQHRGGTMIQIGPSGTLNITAHNGQYNIIFGENRMLVTGAHDITVQGDASLRVDGDYDVNVNGNISFNAQGDLNLSGKNVNTIARGNIDIQGKNRTEKIEGQITQQAQGAQSILAETAMTLAAATGSMAIAAGNQMGLVSRSTLGLKSGAAVGIKATGVVGVEAKGAVTVLAGGALTMSGIGASSICAVGPLTLYGTPISQNLAYIPAPPAFDAALMFLHIPAPPAIPDPQGALDLIKQGADILSA